MAIAERILSMIAQWAKGAQTMIPNPPVPGVAYRNAELSVVEIEGGQSYDKVYDSARYNQMDYTTTGLLQLVEQYGILPYSSRTAYPAGGLCLGLNGIVYQALVANGPNNGGVKATGDSNTWRSLDISDLVSNTRRITVQAPLTGGGSLVSDVSLGVSTGTESAIGALQLATTAETAAGAVGTKAVHPAGLKSLLSSYASTARSISVIAPLTGGGDMSANRSIGISAAGAATTTADGTAGSAVYARDSDTTSRDRAATPAGVATQISAGAPKLATARTIALSGKATGTATSFDGSAGITIPVTAVTADSCTGNAATATRLATARTIGGVAFDGSANINLPGVNAAGNQATSGNAATATKLATARAIALSGKVTGTATSFDGTAAITIPVTAVTADSCTGNAATATKLATARTIGGVSFDGSANITLPGVNAAGSQSTSGNAATATKLATARAIALSGKVTGTATSFDGSAAIEIPVTAVTADSCTGNAATATTAAACTGNAATATKLATARNITLSGKVTGTATSFNGTAAITIPVTAVTADSCTGNAATATKLATARTIGGVSFDGSANISLPGVNAAGNQATTGNAGSATKLATARTIALSGKVTGTATSFNGTANIAIPVTAVTADSCTGNAATATKLATARAITLTGAVTGSGSFDGSGNVSIVTASRVWVSGEYTPTAKVLISVSHNLALDPKKALADAVLLCKTAEAGYEAGDYAQWGLYSGNRMHFGENPRLTANTVALTMGDGDGGGCGILLVHKTTGGLAYATPANWRILIRIYY